MTKHDLATALRQREQAAQATLSDDEIIEGFASCPNCGDKHIEDEELNGLIVEAEDCGHFLYLVEVCGPHVLTLGELRDLMDLYISKGLPLDTQVSLVNFMYDGCEATESRLATAAECHVERGEFRIFGM